MVTRTEILFASPYLVTEGSTKFGSISAAPFPVIREQMLVGTNRLSHLITFTTVVGKQYRVKGRKIFLNGRLLKKTSTERAVRFLCAIPAALDGATNIFRVVEY